LLRLPGADDHDAVWAQLEQDAAAICNALPLNDFIFAAENLKILCAEETLTHRGELSIEATFEVGTIYVNQQ
ncbi:MAG: hypothetical protein LBH06_09345, partial [Rikenellaceae bacterium]|nr:hypothetical protein [Rikenellaceae bacterium]